MKTAAAGCAVALGLATAITAQPPASLPADQAAMRAHVAYLASDAMKGRETGSADYDRAAAYVADQMGKAGLKPAGDETSWFQKVPLLASKAAAPPTMTLNGKPLVFGTDFTLRGISARAAVNVSAPVVFAGYGVVDPATGRNDYKGLDVRGKVVAIFYSGPKGLNSEIAAHLGGRADRLRLAAAHGAVGVLYLWTDQVDRILGSFGRAADDWDKPGVSWSNPDGTPADPGAPLLGVLSFTGAAKLFAGSPFAAQTVRADENAGRPMRTGPIGTTVKMKARYDLKRLSSENVVGRLQGSDATLADQVVILSAHLDHIGITRPVKGDAINNGAMDNAVGVASLLEAAKLFQQSGARPRRSILFLVVTAEEKGLIGSDYFATHPTVPKADIVADVNLDMPILTYRFVDLVALGAERSEIGPVVARVAHQEGLKLTPDPDPDQADFVRSDHYSFVRQGIPSVFLETGPGGPGKAATEDFLAHRYHQPSDDLSAPFDWAAGREFVKVNYLIAKALADAPDRPHWVKGDYFGTLYKGPIAR
jgi:hypothetical protein